MTKVATIPCDADSKDSIEIREALTASLIWIDVTEGDARAAVMLKPETALKVAEAIVTAVEELDK